MNVPLETMARLWALPEARAVVLMYNKERQQ